MAVLVAACAVRSAGQGPPSRPTALVVATRPAASLPEQTDVDRAQHLFDGQGVPYLRIADVGLVRNPAWVALYALEYYGVEHYGSGQPVTSNAAHARACVDWLADHLKPDAAGDLVWSYGFDDTYNDVTIKAPWHSAFGQAVGIQALLACAEHGGPAKYKDLAVKAAQSLLRPVASGGLKFQHGDDVWYEEIPSPAGNPSHILNGHMRALLALRDLAAATGQTVFKDAYRTGLETLLRWLPRYDNGYWLRYDLNPRKSELLFRITNPYGFALPSLAIDRITLTDPQTDQHVDLDVGAAGDASGPIRIAGNDWSQPETLNNRSVRRLNPVVPATAQEDQHGALRAPGTYFYLCLPSAWADNLRRDDFVLTVVYKDEAPGNATIQMRSIAPGAAFRDLPDGDLLLSGSGEWRQWRIPLRTVDLGYSVGLSYGRKHAQYLAALAQDDARLKPWADLARGYLVLASDADSPQIVKADVAPLPKQTPLLSLCSTDEQGVIRQHAAGPRTEIHHGIYDGTSEGGPPVYQPFLIAEQATEGAGMFTANQLSDLAYLRRFPDYYRQYHWVTQKTRIDLKRAPALTWLADHGHAQDDALLWYADFDNTYNDVVTRSPWPSAFFQSYIATAFLRAWEDRLKDPPRDYATLARQAAHGLLVPVRDRGLLARDRQGLPFFEEVPGGEHVLNCDLITTVDLWKILQRLPDAALAQAHDQAVTSLRRHLSDFDAGYWLRYDLNPKKEILFQLDWLAGDASPLVESIVLENPRTGTATRVEAGDADSFAGFPRLSGTDWKAVSTVDGRRARAFADGYSVRVSAVAGGARHNVFFTAVLPEQHFADKFEVPAHRLMIRYKDVAPGTFDVKVQAIDEGNTLTFVPLRGGVLRCVGDGKWKQADFILRPQDMGWYVGPDYQSYVVAQLTELAKQTGDWFFAQYAARERCFFDAQHNGTPVIQEPLPPTALMDVAAQAKVVSSSPTYEGHGVEDALDGNPNNDYVAALEGPLPQQFVLDLGRPVELRRVTLVWESDENFATQYEIDSVKPDGTSEKLTQVENGTGKIQQISWPEGKRAQRLRFIIRATHGQPRLLLRQVKILVTRDSGRLDAATRPAAQDARHVPATLPADSPGS